MKDRNKREIKVDDCAFVALAWGSAQVRYDWGVFRVAELMQVKEPNKKKRDMVYLQAMGSEMKCWQESKDVVTMSESEAMFTLLKNESCSR